MVTTSFEAKTRRRGDEAVVAVAGEVDMYTSPALRRDLFAAIERGATSVVVDLSGVTLLDSSALAVLVEALRRVRASDGSLALVVTDEHVRKVLRITGLEPLFPVYGALGAATESVGAGGSGEGGSDS